MSLRFYITFCLLLSYPSNIAWADDHTNCRPTGPEEMAVPVCACYPELCIPDPTELAQGWKNTPIDPRIMDPVPICELHPEFCEPAGPEVMALGVAERWNTLNGEKASTITIRDFLQSEGSGSGMLLVKPDQVFLDASGSWLVPNEQGMKIGTASTSIPLPAPVKICDEYPILCTVEGSVASIGLDKEVFAAWGDKTDIAIEFNWDKDIFSGAEDKKLILVDPKGAFYSPAGIFAFPSPE